MNKKLVMGFLIVSLFSLSLFVYSDFGHTTVYPDDQIERDLALIKNIFYKFVISVPEVVEVNAGGNITINASINNIGEFTLRKFNFTVTGLPFEYNITPRLDEITIIREWNPQRGVYRVPHDFQIKMNIPEDTLGIYFVEITGQEHFSWRKISNTTSFILRVRPTVPVEPNLTVTNILVPDVVSEGQIFNVSLEIINNEKFRIPVDLYLGVPSDWIVENPNRTVIVEPNKSTDVSFDIVPTNTSGNISLEMTHPFQKQIFTISREGQVLRPISERPVDVPTPRRPTGLAGLVQYLRDLGPIILSILVLIAIIVLWFLTKVIRFYSQRRKPESMKRNVETTSIGLA